MKEDESLKKILIFSDYYIPGYKAGGPIKTIANMANSLTDYYMFKIITLDHDLGDTEPYPNIRQNDWNQVGKSIVYYSDPTMYSFTKIIRIVKETSHDVIYLNSFFSWSFTIKPLLLRRLGFIPKDTPVVLAPRGEFSIGALNLKSFKKKIYITVANLFSLYKNLIWQASSQYEKDDIIRIMGKEGDVIIAPDLPAPIKFDKSFMTTNLKKTGLIKCIFLSRITPMKNLKGALSILNGVDGQVEFNIYGPLEDRNYWLECQTIIKSLSNSIAINYKGLLAHDEVNQVFAEHHIFLFPTFGENFGHVIIESLVAGCPVLTSNQTPWRNLTMDGVGWDLPLDRPELFRQVLQKCVDMGEDEFRQLSQRAREYGIKRSNDEEILEANYNLFKYAIEKTQKGKLS